MQQVFKSKIEKYGIIRLLVWFILFLYYIFRLFDSHSEADQETLIIMGVLFTVIIITRVIRPLTTSYNITKEGLLVIPKGFGKLRIDIKEISSIKPRTSWLEFLFASYVNSIDQLQITYNKSQIALSPKDKEGFIEALRTHNPALTTDVAKMTVAKE